MKKWVVFLFVGFIVNSNSQKVGDSAYIYVNRIYLPFDNEGIIAYVNISPNGSTGQFAGGSFLFSSGFWLSGYTNDSLWANAVAADLLFEDYQAGTVGMDPNDPKASIYKLGASDIPFGQSWQDWIDAVELGADFYDGDDDGVYNPTDKNNNGMWDPDEDRPDLLLDETYWCVYNDGVPANQRRLESEPQGIEIRQTIFATSSLDELGNVVFIRYRIKNTGLLTDTLKDVYFSFFADADVGDVTDDTFGCDTLKQGVYFYNNVTDLIYGNQVPAFLMDLLTGPYSYIPGITFIDNNGNNLYDNGIDTPLDTAISRRGFLGIVLYPGARNLEMGSATFHVSGDPWLSTPDNIYELRNYVLGRYRLGGIVDPCNFPWAEVRGGVPCDEINPYFWCSGDPVTDLGWIGVLRIDIRGEGSTGPFKLVKNEEVEILIGYEVDRDTTPIGGITAVRNVSDVVQVFYENNFGYPLVSVEDEQDIVLNFKLEQNYPNPFNPSTKIIYSIPTSPLNPSPYQGEGKRERLIIIKVYDVLVNEVAALVNEEKQAGTYEIKFDGSGLTSGIYFYRLQTKNFIETKKMVLLR
jgi:hypothetical protein